MLEWNVFISNFNSRDIEIWNVFQHGRFVEDFGKFARKLQYNKELTDEQKKEQFAEELRKDLMYYYWSKCEWEIILQHWPPHERFRDMKVDVYDQVRLNWDRFLEYTWENRRQLWTKSKKQNRKTESSATDTHS